MVEAVGECLGNTLTLIVASTDTNGVDVAPTAKFISPQEGGNSKRADYVSG